MTVSSDGFWERKRDMLREPHIKPLTEFVEKMHDQTGEEIPYFDPRDGGVDAPILFLFSDPGPTVRTTRFISRDNRFASARDASARNFARANVAARLRRKLTVLWNAVPWEVTDERKFEDELRKVMGCGWLDALLEEKLRRLQVVALMGKDAHRLTSVLYRHHQALHVLHGSHPSLRGYRNYQEAQAWLKAVIAKAKHLVA